MDMVQASSFLEEALCDARVGPILLEQAGMRKNGGIDGKLNWGQPAMTK
jgi:hypothetical protein